MKKILLIVGVLIIILCVLALIYAAFNHLSYKELRDATPQHYRNLRKRARVFYAIGISLAVIGAGCIITYFKI
ncbi:MAG: hypothetical protein J6T73_00960 [Clostridia bacterium]|nr:hypothetical protein [Clostridia bacterium]